MLEPVGLSFFAASSLAFGLRSRYDYFDKMKTPKRCAIADTGQVEGASLQNKLVVAVSFFFQRTNNEQTSRWDREAKVITHVPVQTCPPVESRCRRWEKEFSEEIPFYPRVCLPSQSSSQSVRAQGSRK